LQQRCEAHAQGILGAEDHRGTKDAPLQRGLAAQQLLGCALAAQIVTAATVRIGIQSAHVQQPPNVRLAHGAQQPGRKLHMGAPEAGAAEAALIENPDQIDDEVAAVESASEKSGVVDVADGYLDARERQQRIGSGGTACGDAHRVTGTGKARDQLAADKAGAAHHGYRQRSSGDRRGQNDRGRCRAVLHTPQ